MKNAQHSVSSVFRVSRYRLNLTAPYNEPLVKK